MQERKGRAWSLLDISGAMSIQDSIPSLERPHLSNHKPLPPKKCRTKFGDESGFKICPQII